MTKVVYVTGCCGFIGYYVAKRCLEEGYYVIGVDKMTYAADEDLIEKLFEISVHIIFELFFEIENV